MRNDPIRAAAGPPLVLLAAALAWACTDFPMKRRTWVATRAAAVMQP